MVTDCVYKIAIGQEWAGLQQKQAVSDLRN